MKYPSLSRRRFLKSAARGAAVVSFIPLANLSTAQEELPHLSEDNPTAVALNYKHDATETSAPEGRTCSNCMLYSGAADAEWGPCSLFPGQAVNANGWCSAWAARPS